MAGRAAIEGEGVAQGRVVVEETAEVSEPYESQRLRKGWLE
jgi:hypothetical protein